MATDVIDMPADSFDRREDIEPVPGDKSTDDPDTSLPPPPPPPPRRRDRDSRERRDDRDLDRPPMNRRGDYYDRNRSPPPPPLRPRDYKRRASLSPPPPYRDRRHSPPRRSPPFQQFKRPRRDGGMYERRRGSPRGYGGPPDRRFGGDPSGYEREMGARPPYADERSRGRFNGRLSGGYQSGQSDWASGRGGYNDASNIGNSQREGLMSYKQFIQELEDDILPAEAERRYQEYKSEYISTQKKAYFEAHKDDDWLKDKYHPTNLVAVIERRNELARKMAKDFSLDLQSGTIDLGPGVNASNKSGQTSDPNSDDEVDVGGKRRRQGRAPVKEFDILPAPKAHPISSEPRRIQIDIEQALALARKLDSEKGIEDNLLCRVDNDRTNRDKSHGGLSGPVIIIRGLTSVKGLEGVELLDTLVTYLWRIHGLDYYGLVETSEAKGLRHVRVDSKNSDGSMTGAEWEKKLDLFWQERLKGHDPLEIRSGKEKIDATAIEALDPYVRKIRDEKYGWKYGCGAKGCTKLFHAAEFVHKHVKLKHSDLVTELTSKLREDLYFQNYMNDADAPGGTPAMQPSMLKEKGQMHNRLGIDNRLRDERGYNRERDNRVNGNERFDGPENSQSDDGPAGSNPADETTMFDTFAGPPFSSNNIPPRVLMPVPGAGPLGPFVPAPPEVAMQMLRDQHGPSPFESGVRNGLSGPQINGGAPIIAFSPSLRQDPRRLRSYRDLDAPDDDEVTVIDYRSL